MQAIRPLSGSRHSTPRDGRITPSGRDVYKAEPLFDSDLLQQAGGNVASTSARPYNTRETSYQLISTVNLDEEAHEEARQAQDLQEHCYSLGHKLLNSVRFNMAMTLAIMANAVAIGLEADYPELLPWGLIENIFLALFFMELVLRISVFGWAFWDRQGPDFVWNLFDLSIVVVGVIDLLFSSVGEQMVDASMGKLPTILRIIRLLRLLRVLRVIRLVRFLKDLYVLSFGLMSALLAIRNVAVLMFAVIYICSIFVVALIDVLEDSGTPIAGHIREDFGNVRQSMVTLFELMSVPDLAPYREALEGSPEISFFLIFFVVFGSFGMVAVLTGLVCEAMFEKNAMKLEEEQHEGEVKRKFLIEKLEMTFDMLPHNELGEATYEDVMKIVPQISKLFMDAAVPFMRSELENVVQVMDTDGSGNIDKNEFCRGVLQLAEGLRPMSIMELHYAVSLAKMKIDKCEGMLFQLITLVRGRRKSTLTPSAYGKVPIAAFASENTHSDFESETIEGSGTMPGLDPVSKFYSQAKDEFVSLKEEIISSINRVGFQVEGLAVSHRRLEVTMDQVGAFDQTAFDGTAREPCALRTSSPRVGKMMTNQPQVSFSRHTHEEKKSGEAWQPQAPRPSRSLSTNSKGGAESAKQASKPATNTRGASWPAAGNLKTPQVSHL